MEGTEGQSRHRSYKNKKKNNMITPEKTLRNGKSTKGEPQCSEGPLELFGDKNLTTKSLNRPISLQGVVKAEAALLQ